MKRSLEEGEDEEEEVEDEDEDEEEDQEVNNEEGEEEEVELREEEGIINDVTDGLLSLGIEKNETVRVANKSFKFEKWSTFYAKHPIPEKHFDYEKPFFFKINWRQKHIYLQFLKEIGLTLCEIFCKSI